MYGKSIHSFSAFYGPRILEREHWRQSKIIGINHLNCCIGLKMRE